MKKHPRAAGGVFFMIEHLAGHNSFMPVRVRPGDVDVSRGRLVRPQLIITRGCGRTHGQSLTPRVGLEVPPDRNVWPKSMVDCGCGRTRDMRKDLLEMNEMKFEKFLAHIQ